MSDERVVLLEAVTELARLTGAIALGYFKPGILAETKDDGSPVTIADKNAERAAREWLSRKFPDDGVLGEEFGETLPRAGRRWLIDPIDGTKSFVRHVPLWGTLVAVEEGGRVIAGAACFPAVDEMIAAATEQGCWHNDSRCQVSRVASLNSATVLTTDDRFPTSERRRRAWSRMAGEASVARTWGDCYGYLLVATGRAEVMVDDRASAWDAACLQPIIEEAGGVLTDFTGKHTPFGGDVIATNSALATGVRAIMNDE
jgi:histidinol-phosphatase